MDVQGLDERKEGQEMDVMIKDKVSSTSHASIMGHHKSSHVSKIRNQSVDKLSTSNETNYGTSLVHSSIMSKSLAETPHFEMDEHSEKDHKTSPALEEYAPCHIED